MPSRLVTKCGVCGSPLGYRLSLGASPPACSMPHAMAHRPAEAFYPLELLECLKCGLAQLSHIVDPGEIFHPMYPYSSGNTKALHDNFIDLVEKVNPAPRSSIVDIGANDGTLLSKFRERGDFNLLGIEPTEQVDKARAMGIPAVRGFFSHHLAEQLAPANVITACNVLAHVEDIHDVMSGVEKMLAPNGVFVAENHDLRSVVGGGQWDTIYHEHLRYFDPASFANLLALHGLYVRNVEGIPTHGGSFRVFASRRAGRPLPARHYNYSELSRRALEQRALIRKALAGIALRGRRVYGIGAAARATTVIHFCGLDRGDIEAVCEVPGSDKIDHMMPGTSIPVISEELLIRDQPEFAFMFSWHVADAIIPKLRERGYKGTFIIPLPELHYA